MADHAEISRALAILLTPGQVAELRALNVATPGNRRLHTVAGYFDRPADLADAAAALNGARGVYLTLNPVAPALLARAANRTKDWGDRDPATGDKDIIARRWLPVDCDPIRPAGISASDAEHEAALALAGDIRARLAERGWPEPVLADSGNGAHLLYRIDLPAADGGLVKRCLEALALRHSTDVVAVDAGNHNPARIWKVYGTVAAKGDSTPDRPHRLARLLEVPEAPSPVSRDLLEALAGSLPAAGGGGLEIPPATDGFDLAGWIGRRGLDVGEPAEWQGGRRWVFGACPFNGDHTDGAAYIVQTGGGVIAAGCHHNSCTWRWEDLREKYEPGYRERRTRPGDRAPDARAVDGADGARPGRAAMIVRLADVRPERVAWLWPGRLPLGKLGIIDGDPGLGKSTMLFDLAARVTTGRPMPDGARPDLGAAGGVVILSAEDGLADTIRPRLAAAGADLARVAALTGVADGDGERLPEIPRDLDLLEGAIAEVGAVLVIVDPLMAYLGERVNSRQDQDVRRALAPLAAVAGRTGAAVVCVRHLNKMPGGSPLYRGGGSIGIIGAARAGLLVARHPDDDGRRVLSVLKNNLAAPVTALAFRLEVADGAVGDVARVAWEGPVDFTPEALLAQPATSDERGALDEGKAFLADLLAGGRRPTTEVRAESKRAGVSEATLRRAKAALGVTVKREGFGKDGAWHWALPPKDAHSGHRCSYHGDERLWDGVSAYGAPGGGDAGAEEEDAL